jgi:hypothetical protein
MAAKRKATTTLAPLPAGTGGARVRFRVDPSLIWVFGAPARGAFDSERGLVEYVLRFVNGEESAVEPTAAQAAGHPLRQPDVLYRMRDELRAELHSLVSALYTDRKAAVRSMMQTAHRLALPSLSAMPRLEGAALHLDYWAALNSPGDLRAFFLLLLADDGRAFGRALCQCQLYRKVAEGCARFFLERGTAGRPQRRYCSRKHMLAAHAARER